MPCLFCQFVSGKRKKNLNGFPFLPLHQTENTFSFLSIDFPANKNRHAGGHILVISKKHFQRIEKVPARILHELIDHVQLAAKVVQKYQPGCNILLNNGREAGQYVNHVHFHIISRAQNDGVKVESWKKAKVARKEFEKISEKLKAEFRKY